MGEGDGVKAGEVARALLSGHPEDEVRVRVELRLPGGRVLHRWARPTSAEYGLVDAVIVLEAVEVTEMDLLMADFARGGGDVGGPGRPDEAVRYAEAHGRTADELLEYLEGCRGEARWE